jgi:hypothetical protein
VSVERLRERLDAWREAEGARAPLRRPAVGGSGMIGADLLLSNPRKTEFFDDRRRK